MPAYFKIPNIFSKKSKAPDIKVAPRTFDENFSSAEQEDFLYMKEAKEYSDSDGSNDRILAKPAGQLFNAKGEFISGLGYAANAAGNLVLAGSHALAAAANFHNAFAVVTHLGGQINEAKVVLGAGVEAEKILHHAQDTYDRIVGNPVKPHDPSKLDYAYNVAAQADNLFHENTGYLAAGLSAAKTCFYPENVIGFFSRSGKAVSNTYNAVGCEAKAAAALAKAGYYKANEMFGSNTDNLTKAYNLSEDNTLDIELTDQVNLDVNDSAFGVQNISDDEFHDMSLSGSDAPIVL